MELIPVFSLIVLVVTAGTFVLAVGAYVMYKVREKRERRDRRISETSPPRRFEAEVVTPRLYVVSQQGHQASALKQPAREYPPDQRVETPEGYSPGPPNETEGHTKWR